MRDRGEREPERERTAVPEELANRLLGRASELDAARRTDISLADLRAAALEAGIAEPAFDAAVAELGAPRAVPVAATPAPSRTRLRTGIAVMCAMVVGLAAVTVGRATASTIQRTFLLRCLAAPAAAELVRPLAAGREGTITWSTGTPGVITVRTTRRKMARVASALSDYDANSCTVRTGAPAKP